MRFRHLDCVLHHYGHASQPTAIHQLDYPPMESVSSFHVSVTSRRLLHARLIRACRYLFGAAHCIVNLGLWGIPAVVSLGCGLVKTGTPYRRTKSAVAAIFLPLIAPFMIVLPVAGGPIISPFVRRQVYNHMCDSYGAQVVLDGRSYKQPLSVPDTAHFYTSESQQPLFTFEFEQSNLSSAVFRFRGFDTAPTTLSSELVPALQSISYDFYTRRLTGTCNNITGSCLDGTFDAGHLTVDISSNITGTSVRSRSQSEHKQWIWSKDEPSFILRSVADDGTLGQKILQTDIPKVRDCTLLKVCLDGSGRDLVGPEVLAPLGIILSKQVSHSNKCSRLRRGRS